MGVIAFGVVQEQNNTNSNTNAFGFKTSLGSVELYGNLAMTKAPLVTNVFRYEAGMARHMALGQGLLQGYVGFGFSKGSTINHMYHRVGEADLYTQLRGEHMSWHTAAGLEFTKQNWSVAGQVQMLPRTWSDAHYTFNGITSYDASKAGFGGWVARVDLKRQFGFGQLQISASNTELKMSFQTVF